MYKKYPPLWADDFLNNVLPYNTGKKHDGEK